MRGFKILLMSVVALALMFLAGGCRECKSPCSPSIEVGLCDPEVMFCYCKDFQIWTWDPIILFPRNPNLNVSGLPLKPLKPYLFKVKVNNYSNVDVRSVLVTFYWASFGLFDRGTPIGAVGVDLEPNGSRWVSSPWSFVLGGHNSKICLAVRIFHPCDTKLENNWCWRNLLIMKIKWVQQYYAVPFVVDFREIDAQLDFKINAPEGIEARVVAGQIDEGDVEAFPRAKAIKALKVAPGEPQDMNLIIENAGADYKPGDTFDVSVSAFKGDKEVSSFTVQFQVEE